MTTSIIAAKPLSHIARASRSNLSVHARIAVLMANSPRSGRQWLGCCRKREEDTSSDYSSSSICNVTICDSGRLSHPIPARVSTAHYSDRTQNTTGRVPTKFSMYYAGTTSISSKLRRTSLTGISVCRKIFVAASMNCSPGLQNPAAREVCCLVSVGRRIFSRAAEAPAAIGVELCHAQTCSCT